MKSFKDLRKGDLILFKPSKTSKEHELKVNEHPFELFVAGTPLFIMQDNDSGITNDPESTFYTVRVPVLRYGADVDDIDNHWTFSLENVNLWSDCLINDDGMFHIYEKDSDIPAILMTECQDWIDTRSQESRSIRFMINRFDKIRMCLEDLSFKECLGDRIADKDINFNHKSLITSEKDDYICFMPRIMENKDDVRIYQIGTIYRKKGESYPIGVSDLTFVAHDIEKDNDIDNYPTFDFELIHLSEPDINTNEGHFVLCSHIYVLERTFEDVREISISHFKKKINHLEQVLKDIDDDIISLQKTYLKNSILKDKQDK